MIRMLTIATTLVLGFVTSTYYAQGHTKGCEVAPLTRTLKPGEGDALVLCIDGDNAAVAQRDAVCVVSQVA